VYPEVSGLAAWSEDCKWYSSLPLGVVLYGYETWSLTLREEHRKRVFENSVFRRIGEGEGEVVPMLN
jgi:hypothetical protein